MADSFAQEISQECVDPANFPLPEKAEDFDRLEKITLAGTVIGELEPPALSATDVPKTGDVADMALWLAVLVISGGAVAGIAISGEKKKRYVK